MKNFENLRYIVSHFCVVLATCAVAVSISLDARALCPNNSFGDTIINEHSDSDSPIFTKFFYLDSSLMYQWRMRYQTPGANAKFHI